MSDVFPPVPPPGPASTPPPPPPLPPEGGAQLVDVNAIKDDFVAVLTKPLEFWPAQRGRVGFQQPLVFAAAMGLLTGAITAVLAITHLGLAMGGFGFGAAIGAVILYPILYPLVGSFVGGAIVHVLAMVAGGKPVYETSVRIASYSMAVAPIAAILGVVPLLGIVANIYGLYLVALGIVALFGTQRQRTLIVMGVLAVIVVLLGVSSWMAARSASRFVEEMGRLPRP